MDNLRFKFRVWCRTLKQFQYFQFDLKEGSSLPHSNWYNEKEPIQQCTGIEDVKGNLIYEGDILKVVNGSINGIGLSDKWEVKWVGNGWNISQWSFDCTHSYEVIGNIYQNKELLKEQK